MNKDEIDHSSYLRWKNSEFTNLLIKYIKDRADSTQDTLINSHMTDLMLIGKYIGRIHTYTDLLEVTYQDLTGKDETGN